TGLSEDQLESVIAHELAHIKRLDAFVNVFQVCVETLLFYHPAVWWLNKRIRAEREHCCDDMAVSLCGNAVEYARALTMMEAWRTAPTLAMAANRSPLAAKPSPAQSARPADQPVAAQSYIDAMKSAGLTDLTADDLVALKIQGVTPEYVRGMHDLGLHPDADGFVAMRVQGVTPEYIRDLRALGFSPDQDQIIAFKVQGVNADYVRGLKEVGIQGDADQIIALKVQGVSPAYVREMKEV